MLAAIFHLLSGYVEFQVHGDGARFFTVAAKRGFNLWGFCRREGLAVARARPGVYKKMRALCRRCGVRTRLVQKRGAPFQLHRLQKRKSLLVGAVAGAALYVFLSGFVWGVSITGAQNVTPREITQVARDCGVYVGGPRKGFTPKNASGSILTQLPRLSWASVNTNGCFVEIAVKEGAQAPALEEKGVLSNIVAGREGRVVEIQARQGRPEVSLGDTVTQDQLLIAGLYQEMPDPYGIQPPELYQRAGAARGKVVAETYREFTVQVGASRTEHIESGRETAQWLEIFGLRIPLGLWSKPQGPVRTYQESSWLTLLGVQMPLGLRRQVTVFLTEEERPLTKKEQKTAALLKLREAQRTALPPGGSVKEEKLEYVFADGMCILHARSRCLEDIGVERVISVE